MYSLESLFILLSPWIVIVNNRNIYLLFKKIQLCMRFCKPLLQNQIIFFTSLKLVFETSFILLFLFYNTITIFQVHMNRVALMHSYSQQFLVVEKESKQTKSKNSILCLFVFVLEVVKWKWCSS